MKLKRHLKNNNGFTLVELIVTLAIAAIVMTVAGNYLFFGNRMFTENEVKNTDKYIGDTVFSFMRERLIVAGKMEVLDREKVLSGDETPAYSHVFEISGDLQTDTSGCLEFTNNIKETAPADIYGSGFYRNNTIAYTFQLDEDEADKANRTTFILTVYVYNKDGEEVYKTGATIKNLNIVLENSKNRKIETLRDEKDVYQEFRNPVISYEERTDKKTDPLEEIAMKLREDYVGTYEALWDTKKNSLNGKVDITQVKDWPDYVSGKNFGNDEIRSYVIGKNYKGNWPSFIGFSDEMLGKLDSKVSERVKNYLNKNKLYYQPMIGMPNHSTYSPNNNERNFADERCFIYLSTNSDGHGTWKASFVYDHIHNLWYVSAATTGAGNNVKLQEQSIVWSNWQTMEVDLKNKDKWIQLESY